MSSADAALWCLNCDGTGRWWSTVDQAYYHCYCGEMRGLIALTLLLRWWIS